MKHVSRFLTLSLLIFINYSAFAQGFNSGAGHFLLGGNLFWSRTTEAQTYYAIRPLDSAMINVPQGPYETINPSMKLAYGLDLGWLFPSGRSDMLLRYKAFDHAKSSATSDTVGEDLFAVLGHPGLGLFDKLGRLDDASARVKYDLEAFALEAGHYKQTTRRLRLHWVAGINYADIKRNFDVYYSGGNADATIENPIVISERSRFHGWGISGGVDGKYAFGNTGFSLVESARASFLTGDLKLRMDAVDPTNLDVIRDLHVTSKAKAVVVSHLNLRLAAAYGRAMLEHSSFMLLAGYQFDKYFNAVGEWRFVGGIEDTDGSIDGFSINRLHNLSFNGPFIEAQFVI